MSFTVAFAVYGALRGGDPDKTEANIVTDALQNQLDIHTNGIVKIDNRSMGGDPAHGVKKHFGAIVNHQPFACEEGQTVDFS